MTAITARIEADGASALGESHHPWEAALHPQPAARSADGGPIRVVADATLYRPETAREQGAAAWILETYRRHGVDCARHLDGDFAFVLWDAERRLLLAARDFTGRRSLYFSGDAGRIGVATSVGALLADERIARTLDLASIATSAAGLWANGNATAYAAVKELPAGSTMQWRPGALPSVTTTWDPPERVSRRRGSLEAGAEELRGLLEEAVRLRLAPLGGTSVSLSGGWDSTAVLGAGVGVLGATARERLRPVSISYPVGDPGREDELIAGVEAHTGIATRWIEADSIPLFEAFATRAAQRDLPFAHAYESWNRRLSRGAREADARVILDGAGGDQLFQVSDIYLSDLFARGEWLELARQWRGRGGRGVRNFWRWAVRPALPAWIPDAIARLRGMTPPGDHFERRVPPWIVPRFAAAHGLLERDRADAPPLPHGDRVLAETHRYLRLPWFTRVMSSLHRFALDEGVELRSPLLDSRVVEFAAQRPWSERVDGPETKILLRRAMRGLLPDMLLAPRPRRTGVTSAYFLRQLRGPGREAIEATFTEGRLADLGIVDLKRLRHAWEHVLAHDDDETAIRIYFTVQTELWLRAHAEAAR